jgi:zinc protease
MCPRGTNRLALLLLLLITAACAAGEAPPPAADLEALRIEHESFVLDNGLTVIVHQDTSVPIVAVNVWYHVGSGMEQRGKTGFAHLFEHFFFNGSEHHPGGFREAMDDIGVNNRNGTTNTDRTNFFEDVPVSGLERTLYLEADRMGFLEGNLSQAMLERERGVVQNEKRQRENQPYGRVFGRIVEAIYPASHPYSWSTMGSMEDLQAASMEDVRRWYRTYYGPSNCVISLAGDISVERARELVEKYFGAIPPGPPVQRYERWVPRLQADLRDTMQDRVPQARIYRVYHAPGWGDADMQRLALSASVLSGSKSARLDRRLVYERELVTSISAFTWEKELAGNFVVIATVKQGVEPAEVEREIDAVIAEYLDGGPGEEELRRARSRINSGLIRGMERLGGFGGRSDILAESATYGGDPEAYLSNLRVTLEASPAEVAASAREWLGRHHYTLTVLPFPELVAAEEHLDRTILPALGEPPEVRFPEVQSRELANGLKLMLLERPGAPLVNMALAVDAGAATETRENAGIASLALGLMDEGTGSRDAFRIVDELDAIGAGIVADSSLDLSFVRLRALKMNLDPSLEIFADVVLDPAFPEEMVQLAKRRRVERIGQEQAEPRATVLRIVPPLLFGENHPYGLPLTGSGFVESVQGIERDDLVAWHATWFRPNNSTLVVTGAVSMEELLPAVEAAFGGWERGEVPAKRVDALPVDADTRVFVIDKPGAQQSVIVAAHLSHPGGGSRDLAMETVMRLFGGMSTSRLNRNLRLDKHWSYGVQGILLDARGPRPFAVIAPVQSDRTAEAMLELQKEIRGIAGERPIRGEEFASIMRNMVLRLPGRFETLRSLESAAEEMIAYGYPPEYWYDYAGNVRALDESDLNEAAADYIDPARLTWVVIGDLEQVEAGIRRLDFGEVVRLDTAGKATDG